MLPVTKAIKQLSVSNATTTDNIYLLNQAFIEAEQIRKKKLLNLLCIIFMITALGGLISSTLAFLLPSNGSPFGFILIIPGFLCYYLSYELNKRDYYSIASWLLVSSVLLDLILAYYSFGTHNALMIMFMLPLSLAVVLLSAKEAIGVMLVVVGYIIALSLGQDVFFFYKPLADAGNPVGVVLPMVLLIIPATVALILLTIRSQLQVLQTQNNKLEQAFVALAAKQKASSEASNQVLDVASLLKENAKEQAEESTHQLANLTQVDATLQELAVSADQIATFARQVEEVTAQMNGGSQQIAMTTSQAATQSEQGQAAVYRTQTVSQEVANLYTELVNVLGDLNTRSTAMQGVLNLIKSVSAETHLLSLNAAIEAAGAGEYGERFAVVAQEVKRLAIQAGQASIEVTKIVTEIRSGTALAVETAQVGYRKALEMAQEVTSASEVIEVMRQVTEQARSEAANISAKAEEVSILTEVVKSTTWQQRTSSQQVLEAIAQLKGLTQAGTQRSNQLSATTVQLEAMSSQLNVALAA